MAADTATGAPAGILTVTVSGEDAVVAPHGRVDAAAGRGAELVLQALLDAGVRRVIVDLSAVSAASWPPAGRLAPLRDELRARGGWLLVEGDPEPSADPLTPLLEAFTAYREVIGTPIGVADARPRATNLAGVE